MSRSGARVQFSRGSTTPRGGGGSSSRGSSTPRRLTKENLRVAGAAANRRINNNNNNNNSGDVDDADDQREFYEERVWDVRRTKQQFIKQGRFFPSYAECTSLLHDLVEHLNYEPGHLNFEDYAEFCKEALRMSGLAPKQEELRELFAMIDADESGTLERHEILHAVMGDWDVQRLLKNSKTLQPLAAVSAWKRAFSLLKQPDRRLAATRVLKRLTQDPTCCKAIMEFQAVPYTGSSNTGGLMTRPVIAAMAPLLTAGKGAEVAANLASAFGNLAWHETALQLEIPEMYHEYFWIRTGEDVDRDPALRGGLITLLCHSLGQGGGGTGRNQTRRRRGAIDATRQGLTVEQRGEVAQAVHNFCYCCPMNKSEVINGWFRPLQHTLKALAGEGMPLETRKSAHALICLLELQKDEDF